MGRPSLTAAGVAAVVYAVVRMVVAARRALAFGLRDILLGAGATFLRVELVLLLAGLWTIPVGVFIGLRPRLAAIAQPVAQIAASVPATALFPIVLLGLIRLGGGLGIGSIVLLLLGTQWYLLFNVIAGASAIPTDLKEVCDVYRLNGAGRWRKLLLPGIFPFLITGFVTASGGAWNASIVAEYFRFHGQTIIDDGPGSGDQPRHGPRRLRGPAGGHHHYGGDRRDHESSGLAAALRAGVHALQTGSLNHPSVSRGTFQFRAALTNYLFFPYDFFMPRRVA